MICAERARLLEQYGAATKKLTAAVQKLSKVAGAYEYDAFHKAWKESEATRAMCASLRNQIANHVCDRRCKDIG